MFEFERIAEQRILDAISRGDLRDLPGEGRPLELDDDSLVPPEMRMAYRILKNAGYIPEEASLRRQIHDLERALDTGEHESERLKALRKLDFLRARLSARRGVETACDLERAYREKLLACFERGNEASGAGEGRNRRRRGG